MTINEIAMVCHEVKKALCNAFGDTSQPRWADAPQWQIESAINSVKMHLVNEAGPETSHEAWMKEKVDKGWVYGEVKDAKAKTHPGIVNFADLPPDQQAKDYIFRAIVHALRGKIKL